MRLNGAGGQKISWKPMGTLWTRNITPDAGTGIGRWTDAQIARAIRSGISADGRPLHWQGMIWDHLSNLDEEDVRALIAASSGAATGTPGDPTSARPGLRRL